MEVLEKVLVMYGVGGYWGKVGKEVRKGGKW